MIQATNFEPELQDLVRINHADLEALGGRFSRNLERLTGAIGFAALVIAGSMILMTPMSGWLQIFGEAMLISGIADFGPRLETLDFTTKINFIAGFTLAGRG